MTEYQSVHFGGFCKNGSMSKMNTMTSFRKTKSKLPKLRKRKGSASPRSASVRPMKSEASERLMSEENKDSKEDLVIDKEEEEETNMLHESAKAMKTGQFSI